ncbi:MAG: serine/threonine-protein kinase [Planctomycetota bacterium]
MDDEHSPKKRPASQIPTSPGQTPENDTWLYSAPPATSFPGYEIVREIHRGGQGVVYQAIQKSTKRRVALKVMKEGPFASPADRIRFEREVEILGQLNHPNIVAIHDSGTVAGNHYFIMDYISGQSLDAYMESRAGTAGGVSGTLRLFARICDAVNAAHLRGVIHRDLKPGNIRIDADGEPHILDFGLAKFVSHPVTDDTHPQVTTLTGQFFGSIPWASPEQAEALPGKIDIRTDVYSLGVILYQMLTGKFPYEVTGNVRDVLDRIITAAPARPSTIRKYINDEVETIVLKCLGKERERRYQSAGEVARDIRHYLAGEPIEAKRDSGWYLLKTTLRRYRIPAIVACAFIILITASTITLSFMWRNQSHLRDHAERERAIAQFERDRAADSARETKALLAESYVQTGRLAVQRGDWRTALENYDRALSAGHPEDIALRLGKVEAWISLSQSKPALEELQALQERTDLGLYKGPVLLSLADVALMQSFEWTRAVDLIEQAIEAGLDPADEAYARAMLAERTPDAVDFFRQALRQDPYHHRANEMLGISLLLLGRLDEARNRLEVSRMVYPEDIGPRGLLALVHALQHDLAAGQAIVDEMQAELGAELADIFRAVLDFVDQINRVDEWNEDAARRMQQQAMQIIGKLMPLYAEMSVAEPDIQDPRDMLNFGVRLPPFLVHGIGRVGRATLLTIAGQVEAALAEVDQAVRAHPEGFLHLSRGVLLRELERIEEAEEAFRLAAETPSVFDFKGLALAYAAHTQWKLADMDGPAPNVEMRTRAVKSLRKLASLDHLQASDAEWAAQIAVQAGEYDLARMIVFDWRRRAPGALAPLRARVAVEFSAGAYGPAIQAADAVLAREPEDALALRLRAAALRLLGSIGPPQDALPVEDYLKSAGGAAVAP